MTADFLSCNTTTVYHGVSDASPATTRKTVCVRKWLFEMFFAARIRRRTLSAVRTELINPNAGPRVFIGTMVSYRRPTTTTPTTTTITTLTAACFCSLPRSWSHRPSVVSTRSCVGADRQEASACKADNAAFRTDTLASRVLGHALVLHNNRFGLMADRISSKSK